MGCNCGKKRVRQRSKSHINLIDNLKNGVCRIKLKENSPSNRKQVYCTLSENSLPDKNSGLNRNINLNTANDSVLVWAFNKNIYNNLDPVAGWVKIPLDHIDDYEFMENKNAV